MNELKLGLPDGHELKLGKSAMKKHEKTRALREKGKLGKKKVEPAKQGEGKNAKMAAKLAEETKVGNQN